MSHSKRMSEYLKFMKQRKFTLSPRMDRATVDVVVLGKEPKIKLLKKAWRQREVTSALT